MTNQIEIMDFKYDINFPEKCIRGLKELNIDISDADICRVIDWVRYDIARKLKYSEEWINVLGYILRDLETCKIKKEPKKENLKVIK